MHLDASIVHIQMSIQTVRIITIPTPIPSFNEIRLNEYWPPTVSCSFIQSYMYIQGEKTQTACKRRSAVLLLIVGHLSCVIIRVKRVDDDDDDHHHHGSIFKVKKNQDKPKEERWLHSTLFKYTAQEKENERKFNKSSSFFFALHSFSHFFSLFSPQRLFICQ
jgi:hypothetical protein